jgi:crotonobetainyl-CoA:carnitine CoA-transferase CaiB-like acyl-CoA transferase
MGDTQRTGPLEDITIIDCTMAYAGPFGTALLADLGANVIKVEPPDGDTFRNLPPFPPDHARIGSADATGADFGMAFASVNANKRSICLDLKRPGDREILLKLCEQADAILENMRAGVMDELGVGYEVIAARNPRIVYGAVRGYGDPRTGESPYADWPCLDVAGQSAGGLVEATGDLFGIAIADIYPGTLMALGLLAAVHRARRTGSGDFFDVAMYDSVVTLIKSNISAYGLTRTEHKPGARALVPFGLFPTSDGRIAIAAPVERHWALLCEAMDRPDLVTDERTRSNPRRAANREFTEQQISNWTAGRTKQEIVGVLGGKVPCGPANTLAEVFADPHVKARHMLQEYQLPGDNPSACLAGNPIKFASAPTGVYQRPPRHGEHTAEVLAEFGIARDQKP